MTVRFKTREAERAYLNQFRRYLTKVGFTMADRVVDKYLDEYRGWGQSATQDSEHIEPHEQEDDEF